MTPVAPVGEDRLRAAEVIAATCLATDLGMGFPYEHGLRSAIIAMRLADSLRVGPEAARHTYYASLLAHAGCTTEAHVSARIYGGSLTSNFQPHVFGSMREVVSGLLRSLPDPERPAPIRAFQIARRLPAMAQHQRPHLSALCEVAQLLGASVGAPIPVQEQLAYLTERWDGRGPLRRARGDELPLPIRIVHVAADANLQSLLHGKDHAVGIVEQRAGHAFDPEVVARLADDAAEILTVDDHATAWDEVLALEPPSYRVLEGSAIDDALQAMGNFADLVSPHFTGHAVAVSRLVEAATSTFPLGQEDATAARRAALVHDVGRVAVGAGTWEKAGPLSADEWERVRLHAYHTERILARSTSLARIGEVAGTHHERLDGTGYHRGSSGAELPATARLLAAADAYQAMRETRPHRPALSPNDAAEALAHEAREGRLDTDAVIAVLSAAGQQAPNLPRPAGLTGRESEVIALLAQGSQTKQIARALRISAKTADRHVQNAYRKMGVSSRAAATLFAMKHGLIAWGELPMVRTERGS